MASPEHQRPELHETIIFNEVPVLDANPYAKNGRLLPGFDFSRDEYQKLVGRIIDQGLGDEDAQSLQLPTLEQLYPLRLGPNGCWQLPTYNDQKNRARYGILRMPELTRSALAHRVMYLVFYGSDSLTTEPDKPKLVVDHMCENKACCYPRHLQPVTGPQNTRLGILARRYAEGQIGFNFDD